MNKEFEFKIIGNIGELNLTDADINSIKIEAVQIDNAEYALYICCIKSYRVLYCKLTLNKDFITEKNGENKNCNGRLSSFSVSLWRILNLPFSVRDLSFSKEHLLIMGQDDNIDIKPYVKDVLKLDGSNKDGCIDGNAMDIDNDNDFQCEEFQLGLKLPTNQKHAILKEKFYLQCNFISNSIIICTKDLNANLWSFNLMISKFGSALKSELWEDISLPSIPVTYNEKVYPFSEFKTNICSKPFVTFILHEMSATKEFERVQSDIRCKFLNLDPSSISNCICLMGHPEGKVLFLLCSWTASIKLFNINSQFELVYDLKQPIIGIHFVDKMEEINGNGLLIIGALGKVVFISSEKIGEASDIIQIKSISLYANTLHLPSSVSKYVFFKDDIFHCSPEGDVWQSEFSKKLCSRKKDLKLFKKSIVMKGILDFLLLNESNGLFLFLTKTGYLYLSQYAEKNINASVSLPSLMNEAMNQSSALQTLSFIKMCQMKLFEALSTFASLKLISGTSNLKVCYEILKLDISPKRFYITVTIKHLNNHELNPDFWSISASLFSCLQKDSAIISKTIPFNADTKNIIIEVEEALILPFHFSAFPLCLVVGLILTLPEKFKSMNCFHFIHKELPLYVPIQTFFVSELSLTMPRTKASQSQMSSTTHHENFENLFKQVQSVNMKRPLFNFFEHRCMKSEFKLNYPKHCVISLLASSVNEMTKSFSSECSVAAKFFQSLLQRASLENNFVDETLCYEKQPITFRTSKQNDVVNITMNTSSFILLIGLKMAFIELFYKFKSKSSVEESRFIMISASVAKRCEVLNQDLLSMYGQDVETTNFLEKAWLKYCELREISSMLHYC